MKFIKSIIKNGFKLSAPYEVDNIPVYHVPEEEGVLGRAQLNGCVTVNEDVTNIEQEREIISHEKVHIDQMRRGDLDYDGKNVIWKGKKYSTKYSKNSPWEKEAYSKEIKMKK